MSGHLPVGISNTYSDILTVTGTSKRDHLCGTVFLLLYTETRDDSAHFQETTEVYLMCWRTEATFITARHCCSVFVILASDTKLHDLLTYTQRKARSDLYDCMQHFVGGDLSKQCTVSWVPASRHISWFQAGNNTGNRLCW